MRSPWTSSPRALGSTCLLFTSSPRPVCGGPLRHQSGRDGSLPASPPPCLPQAPRGLEDDLGPGPQHEASADPSALNSVLPKTDTHPEPQSHCRDVVTVTCRRFRLSPTSAESGRPPQTPGRRTRGGHSSEQLFRGKHEGTIISGKKVAHLVPFLVDIMDLSRCSEKALQIPGVDLEPSRLCGPRSTALIAHVTTSPWGTLHPPRVPP